MTKNCFSGFITSLLKLSVMIMAKINSTFSVEEIRERLSPLLQDKELKLVLLFGSSVSGKVHKQSDIDLAFLYDKPADILSLTNNVVRLLRTDSIDVVDLKHASPLLKFAVARTCKIIHERQQGDFNEFYSLSFRMYIDTQKLRDAQKSSIDHFLQARGLA
ncbi:MAG: nucleotidyltransferase domain-containing protein [Candidatus Scalindua sp.]